MTWLAELATILTALISLAALVVAILTYKLAKGKIVKTLEKLKPPQLGMGISKDKNNYKAHITASPGEELTVKVVFANTTSDKPILMGMRVMLPCLLAFVPGSTRLYNRTHPGGLALEDGITDTYANLGGYNRLDKKGRGTGSVIFNVRVADISEDFVSGRNRMMIKAQTGGYIDGILATQARFEHAEVDVYV